tara:strand:- start:12197 stop:13501 length:1305 start_codon:yes stop_codon:yes gene_type:complete
MQQVKIEAIVLGAILMEKDAYHVVSNILQPDYFTGWHEDLYEAIVEVNADGKPIDLLTVCDKLKQKRSKVKAYDVAALTNKVGSSANIESHAWILKNSAIKSDLCMMGLMIAQEAEKDNVKVSDLLDNVQQRVNAMTTSFEQVKPERLATIINRELAERSNRQGGMMGVPTGLHKWDKAIGGLYTGVHVVAARPAMGKTAFAVSIAVNACQHLPVCFWSGEMIRDKIALRVESYLSDIQTERLRLNRINDSERRKYDKAHLQMQQLDFEVDDTPSINFAQLRIKCLKWRAKYGKFILVMDYLGLMDDGGDEYRGVTQNSKNIHAMANELDIPIVLLHQLSRSVESRPDKVPQLSDLRASGGIEQDADTVTFLYRPEYYELNDDPIRGGQTEKSKAYGIIKKNREGECLVCDLQFVGKSSRYDNWIVDNVDILPY